jgi:hypothetical protein
LAISGATNWLFEVEPLFLSRPDCRWTPAILKFLHA